MWVHQLKMNPTKSFLGVASDKFLGFVVTSKGIHLDPKKVCAVQDMQSPKNLRELRGLQGRLAYMIGLRRYTYYEYKNVFYVPFLVSAIV